MPQRVLALASDNLTASLASSGMAGGALTFVRVWSPAELIAGLQEQEASALLVEVELLGGPPGEVLARLRAHTDLPLVALVTDADAEVVIQVLEGGADECLDAGLSARELVTHLRAQIRRSSEYSEPVATSGLLAVGPLQVDLARYSATKSGRPLALTPREFDLLAYLARHAGRTVPREEIRAEVWHGEIGPRSRSLDVHIGRLRGKIEADPEHPALLITVAGVGYRLEAT